LKYLRLTGRSDELIALVEAYGREQGLFHDEKTPEAEYSELLTLDLASVEPSLAGPKRPQDRVVLSQAGESFNKALPSLIKPKAATKTTGLPGLANAARPGASQAKSTPKSFEAEGGAWRLVWKIRMCMSMWRRR
jgi:aconitase A